MNLELFIARRIDAGRRGIMSRIAAVSVALSIAVSILSVAVVRGFKRDVTAALTGFAAPVEVTDPYATDALQGTAIPRSAELEALIASQSGFRAMSPYALRGGIVRTAEAMEGIVLKGVDGTYDWTFFAGRLVDGGLPRVGDSPRTKDLLVSESTARRLRLAVDDRIEMLFIDGTSAPRRDRFRISGIYATGLEDMERLALTDLRNVQRISDWSADLVSGYDVRIDDPAAAGTFADRINDRLAESGLPDAEALAAIDIGSRYATVFDWLRAHDVNGSVLIAVMIAVAVFNMASALLILVLERTRTIGLLKAMGMTTARIRRIFLYRAAFVIGRGAVWGNAAGISLCLLQSRFHLMRLDPTGYMLSEVPVALDAGWWLAVNAGAAAVILLLMTFPTRIVASIRPADAVKYD